MRNILCSLGAFSSCDRKIWPWWIKMRQEIACLSAQGWNRQVDVSTMRKILCSLGAFSSWDGKIWPWWIKIRQEIAYLSAQGWNRQVDVSWLLCWRIGEICWEGNFDRPNLPIPWSEGSETAQNVSHRSSLHFWALQNVEIQVLTRRTSLVRELPPASRYARLVFSRKHIYRPSRLGMRYNVMIPEFYSLGVEMFLGLLITRKTFR